MIERYVRSMSIPGLLKFSTDGALARLPMSMKVPGILFAVLSQDHFVFYAGAAVGCFSLTRAVTAPAIPRLTDRFGQAKILISLLVPHVWGLSLMLNSIYSGNARLPLVLGLISFGATDPPIGLNGSS